MLHTDLFVEQYSLVFHTAVKSTAVKSTVHFTVAQPEHSGTTRTSGGHAGSTADGHNVSRKDGRLHLVHEVAVFCVNLDLPERKASS